MTDPTPAEQPEENTEAPPNVGEGRLWAEEELVEERQVRRMRARAAIARAEREEQERRRQKAIDQRSQNLASVVEYRVGNRSYPYKTVAGCKVCHSPWRVQIETQIASGRTAGQIARDLPEQAHLGYQNIYSHRQKHLPPGLATTVALIERRAEEKGLAIQNGTDLLVDEVTLARLTVQRTTERLVAGEIEPTLTEGLAAGKWLSTIGDGGSRAMDEQSYAAAVVRFFEVARVSFDPSDYQDFLTRVRDDPILAALSGREDTTRELEDGDIEDAEVLG